MRCPNCQTPVPQGATSCPSCGALLDANVVDGDLPPPPQSYSETGYDYEDPYAAPSDWPAEEGTDPGVAPADPPGAGEWSSKAPPPDPGWDGGAQPARGEPEPHNATRVLSSDPERDKHTRVVQAPPPPKVPPRRVREAKKEEEEDPILSKEFEAAISGLQNVYKRLKSPEKVALWSMVAAFVACFSPWYYIKGQGLISGVEANGWIPAVLTGCSLIMLYVRFTLRWGVLSSLLQLLLIAGAAFGAVYYTLVPIHESIKFGLPATALTSALAVVFSVVGMLART